MLNVEERKVVQDKLMLLTAGELREVDVFVEGLLARRRRFSDNVRECE